MPRKLAPKKEGDRMGRPRTGRTQFTIRLDPDASAILRDAGMLYRYCELIAPGNYQGLDRATPASGKVLEMLVRQHAEPWMRETLKRLMNGELPKEVRERLRCEFSKSSTRGGYQDDTDYDK